VKAAVITERTRTVERKAECLADTDSSRIQTALSLVDVWMRPSLFVQRTVSPALMVRFAGSNAELKMLTSTITGPFVGGRTKRAGGRAEPQKTSV